MDEEELSAAMRLYADSLHQLAEGAGAAALAGALQRKADLKGSRTALILSGGNLTTSNVAFAGPRMNQLFVTGALGAADSTQGALFRLELPGVEGLRILPLDAE